MEASFIRCVTTVIRFEMHVPKTKKKYEMLRDGDKNPIRPVVTIEAFNDSVALNFATSVSHAGETIENVVVESIIALKKKTNSTLY